MACPTAKSHNTIIAYTIHMVFQTLEVPACTDSENLVFVVSNCLMNALMDVYMSASCMQEEVTVLA